MTAFLLAALAAPLVVAIGLASPVTRAAARAVAPWAAAPALAVALTAAPVTIELPWLVLGAELALDRTARVFLGFTAALWLAAGVYGRTYLADDPRRDVYTGFYLVAMAGNLGLTVAQDLASFYVCFALMSFASYGLVVHQGTTEALRAGRVYLVLVVIGEVLLFAGFALLAAQPGIDALAALGPRRAPSDGWAAPLLVAGFGIKAGALPLHVWLPLAHPVAPTPASAVLSGAMIKAGLLGWLRFLPLGAAGMEAWVAALVAAGIGAALYGAVVGVGQRDAKTVLAYSSISQMGLITVAFAAALAAPERAERAVLAYATHHAVAKAALFLGVGIVAGALPGYRRGVALAGVALAAAALVGVPLASGAAAKLMLKDALDVLPAGWAAIAETLLPVAAVGTTLLMARFLYLVWPRAAPEHAAGAGMWLPWLALTVGVALAPLWLPGWPGGVAGTVSPAAIWSAIWPAGLGIAIAALALGPARRIAARLPAVPPGDLLVLYAALGRVAARFWRAAAAGWMRIVAPPPAAARDEPPAARALEHGERTFAAGPVAGAALAALAVALAALLGAR